jgi:hypothetical protein
MAWETRAGLQCLRGTTAWINEKPRQTGGALLTDAPRISAILIVSLAALTLATLLAGLTALAGLLARLLLSATLLLARLARLRIVLLLLVAVGVLVLLRHVLLLGGFSTRPSQRAAGDVRS